MEMSHVRAMEDGAAWCLDQYRVRHVMSLLSLDGRQLTCVFDAPDAESVRSVLRQMGQSVDPVWAATVHAPPGVPVAGSLAGIAPPLMVVERRFAEPADFAALLGRLRDQPAWCLDQYRVQFLRSYMSKDRRRMICLYHAPDAESVRAAQLQAGTPVERVWAAGLYESQANGA